MLKKIGAMMGSPAFATGASIVGGLLGNRGQRAANAANAQLAHNQMQFQESMSRTAYQRQVADMKAAGINPMLSAKMGGASTPSGQTAVMQNTAKAGIEGAMMVANLKNMQATARRTNAEANVIEKTGMRKAETDIGQTVANSRKINADRERIFAEVNRIQGETNKIDYLIKQIQAETRKIKAGTLLTYEQTAESIDRQYMIKQQQDLFYQQTLKVLQEERIIKMDADIQQKLYDLKPGNAANLLKILMSMRGRR
jgi:hypothetical protein